MCVRVDVLFHVKREKCLKQDVRALYILTMYVRKQYQQQGFLIETGSAL